MERCERKERRVIKVEGEERKEVDGWKVKKENGKKGGEEGERRE